MIISSKAGARPPCSAPTPLLPPASLEGSWSCAGEIAQAEFPHRFINDTQFGVSLYLFGLFGVFLEEAFCFFFFFFICFGLFQTGAVPLSQLLSPCVCSCAWAGESWQARQEWVGVRGGGQDLFTLGSAPAKITAWNCTLSRQFDYWGTAPSTWFIHVAQNR